MTDAAAGTRAALYRWRVAVGMAGVLLAPMAFSPSYTLASEMHPLPANTVRHHLGQGGASKTCGPAPYTDGMGGQCIVESPGFPGGRALVDIEIFGGEFGTMKTSTSWQVDNLKAGGGCTGVATPADPKREFSCDHLPAGTLSAQVGRPFGSSATIGIRW